MLQAIMGCAEIIQSHPDLPEELMDKASGIAVQGGRGVHLVRQILDFSRISVSERRPLRAGVALAEIVDMLERIIPEKNNVVIEIETDEDHVLADPTQLQQMVTNLVVNACDAMPGGGQLRIGLDRVLFTADEPPPLPQMLADEWLRLTVTDTGTGMSPEIAAKVYEPFFSTKGPGKGTGLGLAQVYGIAKQHDGFLDFTTTPGAGSTFSVFLPPAADDSVLDEPVVKETVLPVGNGELVLLVDDNTSVRDTVHEMLERLGFDVVTARTGSEAIQVFDRFRPEISLLLSDIALPEMDGVEVSRRLREIDSDLPVLLMSGYPLDEDVRALLAGGTADWLAKPFTFDQLARLIGRVLG